MTFTSSRGIVKKTLSEKKVHTETGQLSGHSARVEEKKGNDTPLFCENHGTEEKEKSQPVTAMPARFMFRKRIWISWGTQARREESVSGGNSSDDQEGELL